MNWIRRNSNKTLAPCPHRGDGRPFARLGCPRSRQHPPEAGQWVRQPRAPSRCRRCLTLPPAQLRLRCPKFVRA